MLDTQSQQECPIVFSEMCTYIGNSYASVFVCVFHLCCMLETRNAAADDDVCRRGKDRRPPSSTCDGRKCHVRTVYLLTMNALIHAF
jgi:hypothetical protein